MEAKNIKAGDQFRYEDYIYLAEGDSRPTPENNVLRILPCYQGAIVVPVSQFREDGSMIGCQIPLSFPSKSTEVESYEGNEIMSLREYQIWRMVPPTKKNLGETEIEVT